MAFVMQGISCKVLVRLDLLKNQFLANQDLMMPLLKRHVQVFMDPLTRVSSYFPPRVTLITTENSPVL